MAVLVALVRGFTRREADGVGNFWVDLTRGALHILLPLSLVLALFLAWQGVPQSFDAGAKVPLLEATTAADGTAVTEQEIALGPVASQIAIKQLGTNGGGFFNVNSAHPLENPTRAVEFRRRLLAILLIAGGVVFHLRPNWSAIRRQGIGAATSPMSRDRSCRCSTAVTAWAEQNGQSGVRRAQAPATSPATALQPGGNMEGKEARFGIAQLGPLGHRHHCGIERLRQLDARLVHAAGRARARCWLIQLGEVIFGGVSVRASTACSCS